MLTWFPFPHRGVEAGLNIPPTLMAPQELAQTTAGTAGTVGTGLGVGGDHRSNITLGSGKPDWTAGPHDSNLASG